MRKTLLLSFDTSSCSIHMCLLSAGEVVWSEMAPESATRQLVGSTLIGQIDRALKQAGYDKGQISAIAVGTGPGSFTGIRVGVITARSLAQALRIPLMGISVLECMASCAGMPAAIVMSAGRGHYYAGGFSSGPGGGVSIASGPAYCSRAELDSTLSSFESWYIEPELSEVLTQGARTFRLLPAVDNIAVAQAQIAWERLSLTAPHDWPGQFPWSKVEPLYLRGPSVTVKKSHGHSNQQYDLN